MKAHNIVYLVCLLAVVSITSLMSSCSKDEGPLYISPIPTDSLISEPTISFAADIVPIFAEHCIQCHPSTAELNLLEENAYNYIVNVQSAQYSPNFRILPFDPDNSVLYQKMIDSDVFGLGMPPPNGGADDSQLSTIRTWILEGALDN